MNTIEADYLVVGAGAMGMAFTDTLITDTEASVVVVDRAHQPGGHWTTAYPFVRLHQPSAYYGVNSRPLGHNTIDRVGWNKGFGELATSGEVCAYFDAVMQQQLLPTGRVRYFPMSEYLGEGCFRTLGGAEYSVTVKQRIVDATYLHTIVPSMRPAPYSAAPGVDCISPNELPKSAARERYVIVGAGKTGMDACLWLLKNGISPQRLTWIRPRDAWLMGRETVQPSPTFIDEFRARFAGTLWSIGKAASIEDLFDRLENAGTLLRIDPSVRPTMYRCAIVSNAELDQLRRIEHVIRMGRVQRIEQDTISLDDGSVPAPPAALYIDCTANGLQRRSGKPVFDADRITLQSVRGCQQVFSAAFIAHVEAAYDGDTVKNDVCLPVPHPDSDLDWLRVTDGDLRNQGRWLEDDNLMDWLGSARLNLLADLMPPLPDPQARRAVVAGLQSGLKSTRERLGRLLSTVDA
jgi:NAD(P)-binding Rossmann-like domain